MEGDKQFDLAITELLRAKTWPHRAKQQPQLSMRWNWNISLSKLKALGEESLLWCDYGQCAALQLLGNDLHRGLSNPVGLAHLMFGEMRLLNTVLLCCRYKLYYMISCVNTARISAGYFRLFSEDVGALIGLVDLLHQLTITSDLGLCYLNSVLPICAYSVLSLMWVHPFLARKVSNPEILSFSWMNSMLESFSPASVLVFHSC
jgi:hypothetical protein